MATEIEIEYMVHCPWHEETLEVGDCAACRFHDPNYGGLDKIRCLWTEEEGS